jgi:hypothetical protein
MNNEHRGLDLGRHNKYIMDLANEHELCDTPLVTIYSIRVAALSKEQLCDLIRTLFLDYVRRQFEARELLCIKDRALTVRNNTELRQFMHAWPTTSVLLSDIKVCLLVLNTYDQRTASGKKPFVRGPTEHDCDELNKLQEAHERHMFLAPVLRESCAPGHPGITAQREQLDAFQVKHDAIKSKYDVKWPEMMRVV